MRYQIANIKFPSELIKTANKLSDNSGKFFSLRNELPKYKHDSSETTALFCTNCGSEFYGTYIGLSWDGNIKCLCSDYHVSEQDAEKAKKKLIQMQKEMCGERDKLYKKFKKSIPETCPICGAPLPPFKTARELDKYIQCTHVNDAGTFAHGYEDSIFIVMKSIYDVHGQEQAKMQAVAYVESRIASDSKTSHKTPVQPTTGQIKELLLHLIHLENNIYFLEQRLAELYYHRITTQREVTFDKHYPEFIVNKKIDDLNKKLLDIQSKITQLKNSKPKFSKSVKPEKPILAKPGLFNKKRVLAENAVLTAQYEAALSEYNDEVKRRKQAAQAEIDDMILQLQQDESELEAKITTANENKQAKLKKILVRDMPSKAADELLEKEIAEAEGLIDETVSARNELYSYNIIFEKYRNVVALSSFYEYFMSGRCSALEGADGAYNIYENEIRMNRVISQLDCVIDELDKIKQNQNMIYEEMCNINVSLQRLNTTTTKALNAIQNIGDSVAHISKNSDIIAHNTAVTAYYSKLNAELTNALGYMVAFK